PTPVRPSEAKANGTDWFGSIKAFVTAVFSDYDKFVVEAEDRSSAIVVSPLEGQSLEIGNEVIVTGVVRADGTLKLAEVSLTGTTKELGPLAVNNRDIIGAVGNPGQANLGLLLSTYGKVVSEPVVLEDGSTRFHITDGSAAPGGPMIKVSKPLEVPPLLFEDDFTGEMKAEWQDQGGSAFVENNMLTSSATSRTVVSSPSYLRDVRLEADVIDNRGQVGFIFRFKDVGNFIMGNFLPNDTSIYFHERLDGQWGPQLGKVYDVELIGPLHITGESYGALITFTVTDGTNTYTTSMTATTLLGAGLYGLYMGVGVSAQTYVDNFELYGSPPVDMPQDVVQVAIPASVTGAPSVVEGDYVKVTGIADSGLTVEGNVRAVMIRRADDLAQVGP
ncbi:MAG: hypothetical protein HYX78_11895, partial [Armatimonadetes bacterium]|nr:hypothetical protein [Armatimonadota bacterium]